MRRSFPNIVGVHRARSLLAAAPNPPSSGRRCRGLELDPLYVDVMLRRYEAVARRPAILETTGETHIELAARRRPDSAT